MRRYMESRDTKAQQVQTIVACFVASDIARIYMCMYICVNAYMDACASPCMCKTLATYQ